jgi:hypothetical protein
MCQAVAASRTFSEAGVRAPLKGHGNGRLSRWLCACRKTEPVARYRSIICSARLVKVPLWVRGCKGPSIACMAAAKTAQWHGWLVGTRPATQLCLGPRIVRPDVCFFNQVWRGSLLQLWCARGLCRFRESRVVLAIDQYFKIGIMLARNTW